MPVCSNEITTTLCLFCISSGLYLMQMIKFWLETLRRKESLDNRRVCQSLALSLCVSLSRSRSRSLSLSGENQIPVTVNRCRQVRERASIKALFISLSEVRETDVTCSADPDLTPEHLSTAAAQVTTSHRIVLTPLRFL